jgi:cytochrome P450
MNSSSTMIVPPAPKVHAKDLPIWKLLLQFTHNSISTIPDYAFDRLVSRRRVLGIDSLMMNDPEGVRHVLGTAAERYKRLVSTRRVLAGLGRTGVFMAEGAEWRRQRRMLAPVFTPASVGTLLPSFVEAAAGLITRLDGLTQTNLSVSFQEATLDAVLRALFSLPKSDDRLVRITAMVRGYFKGPGRPQLLDGFAPTVDSFAFATRKRRRFQEAFSASVSEVIDARRRSPPRMDRRDLLDLLLSARDPDSGEGLSDLEIRDQCGTMLVAGYETTARLLFWAAYLLALDRDEQARLRAEISAYRPDRVTKLDDLNHWPRLRQTLLETMRLYPPVAHIAREAMVDDVVVGEPVRAGAQVWTSPWIIQRHRKFWDHPAAFLPDRFAGKPSPWANTPSYIPFGYGPRICIGATFAMAEAQIMMASVLSRFAITLHDSRPVLPVATVTTAPSYEPSFTLARI